MVTFDIAENNPGALTFLTQAYSYNPFMAENAFSRMEENGIKGAKLYMLWNDCCDRDTKKTVEIMINNDIKDIIKHINYESGRGIPYKD